MATSPHGSGPGAAPIFSTGNAEYDAKNARAISRNDDYAGLGLTPQEGAKRYIVIRGQEGHPDVAYKPDVTLSMGSLLHNPEQWSQSRVQELQNQLVDAGLLAKAGARGVYDDATRAAFRTAIETAASFQIPLTPSEYLARFKGKGPKDAGAKKDPFTAPVFQPIDDKTLVAAVKEGLGSATGRVNPDQVNKLVAAFRKAEQKNYEQTSSAAKAVYGNKPSAGTIEQLPTPADFVHANVDDSKEAGMWRAAQALTALHDKMRTGSL